MGRWTGVDPSAESAESMTGYQYAMNSPMMMNDPLGDAARLPVDIPTPPAAFSGGSMDNFDTWSAAAEFAGTGGGGFAGSSNGVFGSSIGSTIFNAASSGGSVIGSLGQGISAINSITGYSTGSDRRNMEANAALAALGGAGISSSSPNMLPEVNISAFYGHTLPSWWGNGQQFVNSNSANQGGPSVQDIRNNIVRIAENYEGSTAWGYYVAKGNFPARCNKCNLYVYDVLKKAGANPGLPHVNGKFPSTAADWANPFVKIPGWIVLTSKQAPMPGDIVAVQENYSDATGHVGIVIGPNLTSSFSSYTQQVTENDWGFRSDNGGWPVFRRYVGP